MARSFGGGGGSSGGGSRSFGGSSGGGSRSFGGFHSGGSSTRRVSSGRSSSYRSSSGLFGGLPPRPPRPTYRRSYYRRPLGGGPIIINNGGGGGGYTPGPRKSGCLMAFLWVFLIIMILGFIGSFIRTNDDSPNSMNTTNSGTGYGCTKYTGDVDKSRGYWEDKTPKGQEPYIDNSNRRELEKGFESFYDETGVWPFIYVVESYDTSAKPTYEEKLYDELFGDCPGNLLFVFDGTTMDYYIAAGSGNGDVINQRTIDVFQYNISKYWPKGDVGVIFGNALRDAGKQLMKDANNDLLSKKNMRTIMIVMIITAGVIIIILIAMSWWKKKKQAQKEEDERLEQLLSQPLSTFGNTELHELGKKYDNVKVPNQAAAGGGNTSTTNTTGTPSEDSVLNPSQNDAATNTTTDDDSVLNHKN